MNKHIDNEAKKMSLIICGGFGLLVLWVFILCNEEIPLVIRKIVTLIYLAVIFVVCPAVFIFLIITEERRKETPFINRPEWSARVAVIAKRRAENLMIPKKLPVFLVAFQFPDGSIKEFQLNAIKYPFKPKRPIFQSFQIGDKGTLIYKEIENVNYVYEEEEWQFNGRNFIDFKKDK